MRMSIYSLWGKLRLLRVPMIGSHQTTESDRRRPVRWLILCGVVLVAGIAAGTAITVDEFRERALSNSERELENTVLLLTRHFDQQFEDMDILCAVWLSGSRE